MKGAFNAQGWGVFAISGKKTDPGSSGRKKVQAASRSRIKSRDEREEGCNLANYLNVLF